MNREAWKAATVGHALVLMHGEYLTPQKLFDKGIWVCYACGEINNLERDTCKWCCEEKFFVRMDFDDMQITKYQMELEVQLDRMFKGENINTWNVASEAVRMADSTLKTYHIGAVVWRYLKLYHHKLMEREEVNAMVESAREVMLRGVSELR